MGISKSSKEEILQNAIALFKLNGYYNTTIANIAEHCGLIKGSIYHHFKSKEAIGLEALHSIHAYFNREIFAIAYVRELSSTAKMKRMVEKTDSYFLHSDGGCLLGNLALEVAATNAVFKEAIKAYFYDWEMALEAILVEHYTKSEASELAKEYVALTQGAVMMMNLFEGSERYIKVGKKLQMLVNTQKEKQ